MLTIYKKKLQILSQLLPLNNDKTTYILNLFACLFSVLNGVFKIINTTAITLHNEEM